MARSWMAGALGLALVLAACVTTGPPTQPTPSTATPLPSSPPTASVAPTATAGPTGQPLTPSPTVTVIPTGRPSVAPPSATHSPIPSGSGGTFGLTNFIADVVAIEVVVFDEDKQPKSMFTLELNEFDDLSYDGIPAGVYRMVFHGATPSPDDPACDFAVADEDTYQFTVLQAGIFLTRSSEPPTDAADLLVPTSSLCHAQP